MSRTKGQAGRPVDWQMHADILSAIAVEMPGDPPPMVPAPIFADIAETLGVSTGTVGAVALLYGSRRGAGRRQTDYGRPKTQRVRELLLTGMSPVRAAAEVGCHEDLARKVKRQLVQEGVLKADDE